MAEYGEGTTFPVIFFDGEREINIRNIGIEPQQVYKSFQFMLAQEIGISTTQISTYLIDQKTQGQRRKIPITSKSNFEEISRERDCCFLVVLKRSRKTRLLKTSRPLNGYFEGGDYFVDDNLNHSLQNNNYLVATEQLYMNPYQSINYNHYSREANPTAMKKKPNRKYFCEECASAAKNGNAGEFHHCVNDVVVPMVQFVGEVVEF